MRIAEIVQEALKEQRDSSEEIIQSNEITYEDMSIEKHEPGAFDSKELTDGESVNTNIEDIPTKSDVEGEKHCECGCEGECHCDEGCDCSCHKESTLSEATMNDLPHEIDDEIHTLKDVRFDLDQTKLNWDLSGIDTTPLDDILANIDNLVANMYQNGAKMADEELAKSEAEAEDSAAEEVDEVEQTEEPEVEEESTEEKKESATQAMIERILTEALSE